MSLAQAATGDNPLSLYRVSPKWRHNWIIQSGHMALAVLGTDM